MVKPKLNKEDIEKGRRDLSDIDLFKDLGSKEKRRTNTKSKTNTEKDNSTESSNYAFTYLRGHGNIENPFTKQTLALDEDRYMRIVTICKKNKISFQDLGVHLVDEFIKSLK